MKTRKPIFVSGILALTAAVMLCSVSCGGDDYTPPEKYTLTFETYGGTNIAPISAVGGSVIFAPGDPTKSGYTFAGWYTNAEFTGEAVEISGIMPEGNVTYYAKFDPVTKEYTVRYEYNIGKAPHAADIPEVTVAAGSTVTVADGNDYGAQGYMFRGWSIYPNGLVTPDIKQDGQFDAGDTIKITDSNITLYAQWAVEYTDARGENEDKIYVYAPLIGKGSDAALLVRADEDKTEIKGFVAAAADTMSGSNEFTFYGEDFENGKFEGRLYGNGTYATTDGLKGTYCRYDHGYDEVWAEYVLALDGFGFATYTEVSGNMPHVVASGDYERTDDGDFVFLATMETDENNAKPQELHFMLDVGEVEGTKLDGMFMFRGDEYGWHILYDPIEKTLLSYIIALNGYGGVEIKEIDENADENTSADERWITTATGTYVGNGYNYDSYQGEWQFDSDNNETMPDFKFVLQVVIFRDNNGREYYYSGFMTCDEDVVGVYTADDGSMLELDGYGTGEYDSNGASYIGRCKVEDGIVTFDTQIEGENGSSVAVTLSFTLLPEYRFAVNTGGIIANADGVVTGYTGKSAVVDIQAGTEIEVKSIADNAFNYNNTGVSLVSVTIPATVTSIGKLAFQNNYTLRRAIFLSEEPNKISIDFSTGNDPFRWGAGDFVIVVPQNALEAYLTAWEGCKYTIMGSDDVLYVPVFEIEDGVLVRYNKPDVEEGVLLDIVIPDEVTEIADNVFLGIAGIKSVDLNNVTKVGDMAFYACADLEKVIFTNVEEIGAMAFAACDKLSNSGTAGTLELPAIKVIGESAFSSCESLKLVQLGADIAEIGDFAFYLCNVYYTDLEALTADPLVVELMGEDSVPEMGTKITLGNIVFRFKVQNIEVALKCYENTSWKDYCRHLYIESGEEKGTYIAGDDTLVLDGRAMYMSSYVWMYKIDGKEITFYEFDESRSKYSSIVGTYENGEITVVIGSSTRHFVRVKDQMTYTTKDGKYTLVCDPMDLQPDKYEDNKGYADVKLNGKDVKLYINGYSTKIIYEFEEDGKLYDITISFNGDTMDVTKKLSDIRYSDIQASDGSKITILFHNGLVYIEKAEFIGIETPDSAYPHLQWTTSSVFATQNGRVFTFTFNHKLGKYTITVTVSEDYTTFTYTHTKA